MIIRFCLGCVSLSFHLKHRFLLLVCTMCVCRLSSRYCIVCLANTRLQFQDSLQLHINQNDDMMLAYSWVMWKASKNGMHHRISRPAWWWLWAKFRVNIWDYANQIDTMHIYLIWKECQYLAVSVYHCREIIAERDISYSIIFSTPPPLSPSSEYSSLTCKLNLNPKILFDICTFFIDGMYTENELSIREYCRCTISSIHIAYTRTAYHDEDYSANE